MKRLAESHDRSLNGEIVQACKAWIEAEKRVAAKSYYERAYASFNSELESATDEMSDRGISITPASLAKFVSSPEESGVPLTEQEAERWLSQQEWYRSKLAQQ